ncbi:MAG: heme-binding protein [Luminiphilus sp.]|nr:heme-binding protein [Luminiphilus sp.]
MRKFAFLLGSFVVFVAALFVSTTSAIEEPTYSLVTSWESPDIEIRDYDSRILATTRMTEGQNSGFRVLAGYIFGGNENEQEIAMTAPVQRTMPGEQEAEMAFVVPRAYSMEELPTPDDSRIEFREEPAYRAAVIRFSGWVNDKKAERYWQTLITFLEEQGIQPVGDPTLNQYNPPWTPPFMRRNEIIVAVVASEVIAQ